MTTYLTDFAVGYVLAKRISNIWLAVLAGFILGIGNTILSSALIFESGLFSQAEFAQKLITGIVFNPIITLGSLWYSRRRIAKDGYFLEWFKSKPEIEANVPRNEESFVKGSVWRDLGIVAALLGLQVVAILPYF